MGLLKQHSNYANVPVFIVQKILPESSPLKGNLFISCFLWFNLLKYDAILMGPDFVYYRERYRVDGRSTAASDTDRYSQKIAGFYDLRSCFACKLTPTKSISHN